MTKGLSKNSKLSDSLKEFDNISFNSKNNISKGGGGGGGMRNSFLSSMRPPELSLLSPKSINDT